MWKSVLDQLDGSGLVALGGTAPHISVVGYSLGGGLSWFGRKYGLASSAVRSVDLVRADGELTTVTSESDADLFWALRGFGGEFGVVTSMEFDLSDSPGVIGVRMLFPGNDARPVLEAFSALTAVAPVELTATASLLNLPDAPFSPRTVAANPSSRSTLHTSAHSTNVAI